MATHAPQRKSFRSVLANQDFFRLWLGQIVASIGDRFYQFAILYVVLRLSPDQGVGVGKESARVLFSGMILNVLLAPWIGQVVDRFSRKSVMVFSDLARAVLSLLMLCAWLGLHSPPVMFALIAISGLMTGIFIPARQASVPQLVPPAQLMAANALVSIIGVVASLMGACAGFIVAVFGEKSSFLITAGGFLFSCWMLQGIRADLKPRSSANSEDSPHSWKEIFATIREGAQDPVVRQLFAVFGCSQFIVGLFLIFVLEHSTRNLDLAALSGAIAAYGHWVVSFGFKEPVVEIRLLALVLLLVATGFGLVIGVWLCGKARRFSHYKGLPVVALIAIGGAFVLFAGIRSFGTAWCMSVGVGLLGALMNIPVDARMQSHCQDHRHGKLFAARNALGYICFLCALALNLDGRMLEWRGAHHMMSDLGYGTMVAGVILVALFPQGMKGIWHSHKENDL